MKITKFNQWQVLNEEAAARIPNKEEYWKKKGKIGKKVALYTHDDMDGIFCAIEMRKWLDNKGFEIVKYGLINYSEGWKYTSLDPKLINIVLDFANMPGDSRDELIDYYLDHHGLFSEDQLAKYKSSPVQKKATASAYEALCLSLGVPMDELVLDVIDMIDAAKYDEYGISWQRLLNFDISSMKSSPKRRLEFAAAFNQFLKRSDTKTIISVIKNCRDVSIYAIYNTMKMVYPEHNVDRFKKTPKDFRADADWRITQMQSRTRGKGETGKPQYNTQQEFQDKFTDKGLIKPVGYQLIGDMVFIPSGTWANAPRARAIVEADLMSGFLKIKPKFILLQYGGTLQVCSYEKIGKTEGLPKKDGKVINDLGEYMKGTLKDYQDKYGYYDPKKVINKIKNFLEKNGMSDVKYNSIAKRFTFEGMMDEDDIKNFFLYDLKLSVDEIKFDDGMIQLPEESTTESEDITPAGGHGGIGSISNIFGTCKVSPYEGCRFIDMFKNQVISDLSGVKFDIDLKWSEAGDFEGSKPEMDNKVIMAKDVTTLDRTGRKVIKFNEMKF